MKSDFTLYLDLQLMVTSDSLPDKEKIKSWIRQALLVEQAESGLNLETDKSCHDAYELTLRIVDKDEIQSLNQTYRHIDKPTNVLSFPFEIPSDIPVQMPVSLLGDLIICHDVIVEEAMQQSKTLEAHWTHMVVHGVLHLKGYDHINDDQATIMESLEIKILESLHISNPYE